MPSKKRLDKTVAAPGKQLLAVANSCVTIQTAGQSVPTTIATAGRRAEFAYEEFLYGRIRNRYTRRNYRHAVEQFFCWVERQGLSLQQIFPQDVGRYLDQLSYGPATKKLHLAALRHLFDQLVTRHVTAINPAATVRGDRQQIVEGRTPEISAVETRRLLSAIDTTQLVGLRDWSLIGVLVYTVARVGAVAQLKRRSLMSLGNQTVLDFADKGGKRRQIPVRHDLEEKLLAYLTAAKLTAADGDAPLFRTAAGRSGKLTCRGMSRGDICRMVKRRLRAAGLSERYSPHSFRVVTITDLLSHGVALDEVQHLAGHADPRTTRLYDRRQRRVTRNIVERISI